MFIPIMLPNDAHYNPNYILMLKSNASIHHWNEIQMLTIDKLNNKKKKVTGLKTV